MSYVERRMPDTGSVYRQVSAEQLSTREPVTIDIDDIGKNGLAYLVIRKGGDEVIHVELDRDDWRKFKESITDKPF